MIMSNALSAARGHWLHIPFGIPQVGAVQHKQCDSHSSNLQEGSIWRCPYPIGPPGERVSLAPAEDYFVMLERIHTYQSGDDSVVIPPVWRC